MKSKIQNNLLALIFGITFCILILLVSELILTLSGFDQTYGFSEQKKEGIFIKETIGETQYYIFQPNSKFRQDSFKVNKNANTLRIFVLGGSAAFGYPLEQEETFSYLLEKKLNQNYKTKTFEVINLAYPGSSSKEDLESFKEILNYEPDFVVLYSGNNEFLTLRHNHKIKGTGLFRVLSQLEHIRTFNLMKRALNRFTRSKVSFDEFNQFFPMISDKDLDYSNKKLLQEQFKYNKIHNLYLSDYSKNIHEIIKLAKERDIKIIISNIPTNIQWPPLKSIHILKQNQNAMLVEYMHKGDYFIQKCDEIIKNLGSSLVRDPFYAEYHYYLGLCYKEQGNQPKSDFHLKQASDFDAYPLRHPSSFNDELKQIVQQEKVLFVDVIKMYQKITQSENFNELFYDYNHPNKQGHEIIAEQMFQILNKNLNLK